MQQDNDQESARLDSLRKMDLLTNAREAELDLIVRLASKALRTDMAQISLVDRDRVWLKARCGSDDPSIARDASFAAHAIKRDRIFVVEDAAADPRFAANPLVIGSPKIRFYAGKPLINRDGYRIGTLDVSSHAPRKFSPEDAAILEDLADLVEMTLDKRHETRIKDAILEIAAGERSDYADLLTGVANERGLKFLFQREFANRHRKEDALVLGVVAVDGFDQIGELYGTPACDQTINLTAELLMRWSRRSDIVARRDQATFIVVLFNVVPMLIPVLGEKLLRMIRNNARVMTHAGKIPFTASIGFVGAVPPKYSKGLLPALVQDAEEALRSAQSKGGNRYEMSGVPDGVYTEFALA